MKRNSLSLVFLAVLGCLLMQPVGAQVVEVTDPLNLFDRANDQAASQILSVGHFFHGGQGAACCDTPCDGGCDSLAGQPSCDAMGTCCCRPGKPKCECCKCRKYLFGDLMGARSGLAEHGIEYSASLTQFYQGVTSGGAQRTFRYGGKLDQYCDLSTEKMGLWKGGLLEIHAPMLYGESSTFDAALLAPANIAFLIPRPFDLPVISITNFSYTQELGGGFAATAGKYDFLDLWSKFLPDYGKGIDGFMNVSSIIFLNVVPTLPTVFNGAGLIKAGEKGIEAIVMVLDPTTTATVSGISDLFDDGSSILGAYRIYTDFAGLPGSHLAAGVYSNRVYTNYDRNGWSFHPEVGVQAGQKSGSWLGAYVGEQTLWQDRCNKNRKVWFLTTMGWADRETSPFEWAGTYSIEAKGLSHKRPHDRMGIAYFYTDVSDDLENLVPAVVGLQDVQGGEFYYNAEINPWFHVTGDLQVIDTEIASQDTAIVLGVRAKIDL